LSFPLAEGYCQLLVSSFGSVMIKAGGKCWKSNSAVAKPDESVNTRDLVELFVLIILGDGFGAAFKSRRGLNRLANSVSPFFLKYPFPMLPVHANIHRGRYFSRHVS